MKSMGFERAWALEGGLDAWRESYPVEEMAERTAG
jgi:rhodanese-related sulfurtransferase